MKRLFLCRAIPVFTCFLTDYTQMHSFNAVFTMISHLCLPYAGRQYVISDLVLYSCIRTTAFAYGTSNLIILKLLARSETLYP